MLEILFSWLSPFRYLGIWIDSIAYSLIDNAYNLIVTFSKGTLLKEEFIVSLMNNLYVVIGIFALFRIAMLLVNSIINPDKLSEKGNGLANVFGNFIIMFVMLVMTPFVFREAINLQTVIVDGNYIQKLFIKADAMEGKNPGKAMRSIAIGSLITLDEVALEQCEGGGTCSNNAKEAIEAYRDMEKNGFSFPTLSKYIGVSIKDDDTGEVVYVYNYMFLVTFAAGIFIAYVLFSFGIDIAVRMVELTVLQILAPLFIATYIDPKSAKSGTFHKWLTTVGKTYASLFIKLAILSLMLLLISIVSNLDYYGSNLDLSGFEKLVLLFAILIFAKKAPKWIGDMVGVEGAGLGGLGIGKKLGGAALLGGLATKAARGLAGGTAGVVDNVLRNARHNRQLKKDADLGGKERKIAKAQYKATHGKSAKGFRSEWSGKKRDAGIGFKDKALRNVVGIGAGVVAGFNAGVKSDKLTGAFKGGINTGKQFADERGLGEKSLLQRAGKKLGSVTSNINDAAYGDAFERYKAADDAKKRAEREKCYNTAKVDSEKLNLDDLAIGFNDVKKLKADNLKDAIAINYANAKGYKSEYITDNNGNRTLSITDKNGNIQNTDEVVKRGASILGDSGVATLAGLQTQVAQNALSENASNAQMITQLSSAIASMSSNISNIKIPKLDVNGNLDLAGQSIKINKDSIASLGQAYSDSQAALKRCQSEEQNYAPGTAERIAAEAKTAEVQNASIAIGQLYTMKTQVASQISELATLQNRQEQLQPIIDNVGKEYTVDVQTGEVTMSKEIKDMTDMDKKAYLEKQKEKYDVIASSKSNKESGEKK